MGSAPFTIVRVPPDAHRQDETLGTKFKFWYLDPAGRILFKRGRANEDWSEKIAAELAHLMKLPAAVVELAEFEGTIGIVSPSFLAAGEELFHGNELLMGLSANYPAEERYHVGQHTLDALMAALENARADPTPGSIRGPEPWNSQDQMVGYLMLDALVGNTDRHHENWAVVQAGASRYLSPTYDHASSLGRNEPARRIDVRLSGKDPRVTVGTYAARARSAIYADPSAKRPLSTLQTFRVAADRRPDAARFWFERLDAMPVGAVEDLFERLPADRISARHREFAVKLLSTNTSRLRAIVSGLDGS